MKKRESDLIELFCTLQAGLLHFVAPAGGLNTVLPHTYV
jgi:hypothetical protein